MAILTKTEKYVAESYAKYFGRAADADTIKEYGLKENGKAEKASVILKNIIADADAEKAELSTSDFVNNAFQNLFGRNATTKEMNKYSKVLQSKNLPINSIVKSAAKTDKAVYDNKKAVALKYAELGGKGDLDLSKISKGNVVDLKTVTTLADLQAKYDALAENSNVPSAFDGKTFVLTEGVDTLVGTEKNDVFNAVHKTATPVVGGLDKIDGGAGTDTLNITDTLTVAGADFTLPAGMKITNVETLNVTTNGGIAGAVGSFDISTMTGLTSFTGVAAGAGTNTGSHIKAAGTTDVSLTVAGANTTTVDGGKTVSITGGAEATVTDAAGAAGTTLTAVSLSNVGSAGNITSVLTGNGIASVTLSGSLAAAATQANTITVSNTTVDHALTINAAGTGYDLEATPIKLATAVNDAAATSLTINTSAKSAINVTGSTLVKTVTLTGAGELDLAMGAATTINGSAATGALLLNTLNAATVNVSTGSGNDKFTANTTNKLTIDTGAGNDIVTLSGALVAGSTIKLGAGNDTLLGLTVAAASTATAITSIDGGDGIDSVASTLINAGNAAKFVNFENISIGNATVDAALLTASTITGLSIDGATGTGVLQNVTQAQSLTVNANNAGSSTLTFTGVTGTADAYAITFNSTSTGTAITPTTIGAGTVVVNGIENVTIHSNAAAGVAQNSITLTDSTLQTLSINGSQELTVAFAGTNGTVTAGVGGVSSIDASAATGKLDIDLANITAANAGLTVKGGSAADTLTTSTFAATLTGNGGNDKFVVDATLAGNVSAIAAKITTITDFTKGDIIEFANQGLETFTTTKVDVSAAINLDAAVNLAASTTDYSTNGNISWFNYGGNTYLLEQLTSGDDNLAAADIVVKLTGTLDLSTSTIDANGLLTFA